jgi:exopolyphosphatase/guanosine-5'-triphosphate,3'-diphosphate pyrophosphatase
VSRVAAIDCGTNSIRLLVADVDEATGTLRDLDRRMQIVRLGEGVDRTGRLGPAALARTFAACEDYAGVIEGLGVSDLRFVATSATRDASNRAEFVSGVRRRLAVVPEVISGAQEAGLSFLGATRGLTGVPAPYLVADIGGGSTELVLGRPEPVGVIAARSVDIGCVRMTERHFANTDREKAPPADRVAAATADIDAALEAGLAVLAGSAPPSLIGLAGSVTTVAGIALGLASYDPALIHGSRIPAASVRTVSAALLASDRATRAAIPVMHPGRVDVIGAGALILRRILDLTGLAEVVVSEHDILDGIALSMSGLAAGAPGTGPGGTP